MISSVYLNAQLAKAPSGSVSFAMKVVVRKIKEINIARARNVIKLRVNLNLWSSREKSLVKSELMTDLRNELQKKRS